MGAVVIAALLVWVTFAVLSGGVRASAVGVGIGLGLMAFLILVLTLGYFPWFWARTAATPGMRARGLRVVRDADRAPISTGQAVLRLVA